MILLIQKKDTELQGLDFEYLRHLSSIKSLKKWIFESDTV